MKTGRLLAVISGLALQLGCNSLTDPAVRLAYCLEGAIKKASPSAATIQASCDLELPGSYVVVLHPAGQLTDEQLAAGGVPSTVIPEVRALRIADTASIYVISTDRKAPSSRTTYQNNFVQIDRLIAVAKTSQPLTVEIGGAAGARVITAIR